MNLKIGIDASNLLQGGGRTHLIEVINACELIKGSPEIVIWGRKETLEMLRKNSKVKLKSNPYLEGGFFKRFFWQTFLLAKEARNEKCNVLWVPGGNYLGSFSPTVVMSRNMLPFEAKELFRYFPTLTFFKLALLRFTTIISFKQASGVIFLSNYAKNVTSEVVTIDNTIVIPHGIGDKFKSLPKVQRNITYYDDTNPLNVLYVSSIDFYKHQWIVIEAISSLRKKYGWPLKLTICGPTNPKVAERLVQSISKHDHKREWINYLGSIPYLQLREIYKSGDIAVFASSCENMPNTLIEYMIAGLPIACSSSGPMPEILGSSGIYFNPENPQEIELCLKNLILDTSLRSKSAMENYEMAQKYSWIQCAESSLRYLSTFKK